MDPASAADRSAMLTPPLGEAGLRLVLEQAPIGMIVIDAELRLRWYNRIASEMLDGRLDGEIGRSLVEVARQHYGDEVAAGAEAAARACLATGTPRRRPYWAFAPAESAERWFDVELTRIALEDGGRGALLTLVEVTAHVHAQRALADSESRWRAFAEGMPQLVWSARPDGGVDHVNEPWVRFTGMGQADLHEHGWLRAMHPQDASRAAAAWALSVATGAEFQLELRLRAADGAFRWFLARAWPRRDAGGAIQQWLGACVDVHDQKVAEQALRDSERRLRWLVENTTESIWRFELDTPIPVDLPEDEQIARCARDGRWVECNQAMARAHGFTSAQAMIGLRLGEVLPLDEPRNLEFLRAFVRSGYRLIDAETVFTDPTGRRRYQLNNLVARIEDGQARGGWGSGRDITAYREAEEATREAEERLRLAVEAADVGTWDYDPERDLLRASERLRAMLALDAGEEVPLHAFFARIVDDDRDRVRKLVAQAISAGAAFDAEFRVAARDGERWFAAKGRRVTARGGDGRVTARFLGAATDTTARKRVEEQLARKAGELERSNAELEQFAYVASHDLQEPLRMVISYLQLLQKRYAALFDDKAREYFAFATSGAERMRAMIQAVLEYSRVGRREATVVELDSGRAVRDALDNLRAKIAASKAVIECDALPRVRADPVRLTQLFQNLVSNALKFRRPDVAPLVRIDAVAGEREWTFRVADNGIGIQPEAQDRIFMLFQRLHTIDEYPGSGIGLATCKKIVERMGGRIWVESTVGVGSRFCFTLPR